jgi:hypothetical protein
MTVVVVRRRKDRAVMGGASADDHVLAERNLARGRIPGDPREREALRRLVAHRRRRVERHPWLFVPLIVVLLLLPAVWALQGMWPTALLVFVFAIVFGSWATGERRRNRGRLRHLDRALGAATVTVTATVTATDADSADPAPAPAGDRPLVLDRRTG